MRVTRIFLALGAVFAAVLVAVFLHPALDLDAARLFYVGPNHFVGNTPAGVVVRYAAWTLPFVLYGAMLLLWLFKRGSRWAPSGLHLIFLTLSLAIGPGLIVHVTLKEISHRPRPYSVTAFGGPDSFRPFTKFDGVCPHNCAFPSGEMSAATWTLAPASLVPPPWRGAAVAAAIVFALGTGGLRMAFGGHFLSDVAAAGLITIAIILLLRWLLLRAPRPGVGP